MRGMNIGEECGPMRDFSGKRYERERGMEMGEMEVTFAEKEWAYDCV